MNRFTLVAAMVVVVFLSTSPAVAQDFVPVTDSMLQNPDPADWLMWRRTLNSWGYSPLDQIDRDNVDQLRLVWTRGLSEGIQEGTPLVYDGVMYFPNPADVVEAFDAATGDFKWRYQREWPDDLMDYLPVPSINRNLAIYGNVIIDTSADDYVFALDALTGELAWETLILDYQVNGAQQTSGPIIADGKIISGRGCEPEGGPDACIITAHDATTGEELWRTRTIPAPGEPGDETWGDVAFEDRWHVGTWMVPSYDPELGLIYIGTSVTSPAPKFALGGNEFDYLYHNSTLALNADTGEIEWYYQHLVDHWDLDHPFERLIVDTAVSPDASEVDWISPNIQPGETRRVLTGIPGKTGLVYTLDRETGEFLWARPTVTQTVIQNIDGETGEVMVNPEMLFTEVGQEMVVCPTTSGGKGFPAGAYSPLNNTMYYPLQNTCMSTTAIMDAPSLQSLYGIRNVAMIAPGSENIGTVQAISAETGRIVWKREQNAGAMSLITTGSGLLFGGDSNGRFRAFDQNTGEVLWETNLGSAVTGYPATFAVDGRQYVAISTGTSLVTGGLNRMAELQPSAANNIFVFALPER